MLWEVFVTRRRQTVALAFGLGFSHG